MAPSFVTSPVLVRLPPISIPGTTFFVTTSPVILQIKKTLNWYQLTYVILDFGFRSYFVGKPKMNTMKAHATLKNLNSESCKPVIIRNLNRILDVRIIDIDVDSGMLHFLCNGQLALEKVKKELARIGFPVQQCDNETLKNAVRRTNNSPTIFFFIGKERKPYFFKDR